MFFVAGETVFVASETVFAMDGAISQQNRQLVACQPASHVTFSLHL